MSKRGKQLLVVGVAAAAVWGAWTIGAAVLGDDDEATSTRWVVNQVWIERLPTDNRDMIGHLAVIDHPEAQFGIAGKSSQWRHFIEAFLWKLDGQKLGLYFPQDEVRTAVNVKTWNCEGDAPSPFQLCLEISRGDRKATYYSRRDWKIEPHDVDGSLQDIGDEFPAVAALVADELDATPQAIDVDAVDWQEVDRLP